MFVVFIEYFCFLFCRSTVSIWTYKGQEGYNRDDGVEHGMLT